MQFNCEVRTINPALLLVTLKGVLDAGTSIELEMALADSVKNAEVRKVVLEVSDLTFISSSGLRVMMLLIKTLTPRGGKLYMIGATAQIVGLVKMSGMTKWIHLKNNLAECESD